MEMTEQHLTAAETFCGRYLDKLDIGVRFNGSLFDQKQLQRANNIDELSCFIEQERPSFEILCERCLNDARQQGLAFGRLEIQAALRSVIDARRRRIKGKIIKKLYRPLSPKEREKADRDWATLAGCFAMDPALVTALFKQFLWCVKCRAGGHRVADHLIIVIVGPQGTGKSEYIRDLLAPLQELVAFGVLVSDIIDPRSGDLFSYPVIVLDDMGLLNKKEAIAFKNISTSETLSRRTPGSARVSSIANVATMIGSSNLPIQDVVQDKTGHRRFVTVQYCADAKGEYQGRSLWGDVKLIDFEALWRSVDVFESDDTATLGAPPIASFRNQLRQYQQALSEPKFGAWLKSIDFGSERIMNGTNPLGVSATTLRDDYIDFSGENQSDRAFARLMDDHMTHPDMPFDGKARKGGAGRSCYLFKRGRGPNVHRAEASNGSNPSKVSNASKASRPYSSMPPQTTTLIVEGG